MGFLFAVGRTGESAKSGPIGLAVILVLCVAVYFLFKSMSKHLKKVREEFPSDQADQPAASPPPLAEPTTSDASPSDTPAETPRPDAP